MAVVREGAMRAQERFLRRVFGEGRVSRDAPRRAESRRRADANELRESLVVSRPGPFHEASFRRELL